MTPPHLKPTNDPQSRQLVRFSKPKWRKLWLSLTVCGLSFGLLQSVSAQEDTPTLPQTQVPPLPQQATENLNADTAQPYVSSALSETDRATLNSALSMVRSRNFSGADALKDSLSNPVARKIVTWQIINNDGNIYSFAALDAARRDLWGWPREAKRQITAEKLIASSGMTPQQTVDWFAGAPPQSIEGATALITAYANLARADEARALAKSWWRTAMFDSIAQNNFYQAFSTYLTQDDHKARLNCLMLNTQGATVQSIRDMSAYVDDQTRILVNAVIALRSNSAGADSLYTAALATDPHNNVLAFARARYLSGKGLEPLGFSLLPDLPSAQLSPDAATQIYRLRLTYFRQALKAHDYHAAYNSMNNGGFDAGESKAEAEFFAGWMALIKLNDTNAAIAHFQALASAGTSPITQGRANYWLGRAYEARNSPAKDATSASDADLAKAYYAKGGQYIYAFYGQMAAEKAGVKTINIGKDPVPSKADRDRFENRDLVRAARMLGEAGQTDLFRAIVLNLDTVLPNAEEEALLVDLTAGYDTQIMAMKVARTSMQRGFYLPERAYPLRDVPAVPAPEKAFVLAITRQESGFDPSVRSRANAKGMMQLIPSTARAVARRLSIDYSDSKLYEPEYNMTLGAYHLGELVNRFDGSYIMAAAGYNAGPSRMNLWVSDCGDPRGTGADALSFIECMPLGETRDYMMRVTENMRIYRARLNGGTADLTAAADVTRGQPVSFSTFDAEDMGDGSTTESGSDTSDGPVSYLQYQKTEAAAAAAAAAAPPPPQAQPVSRAKAHELRSHGFKAHSAKAKTSKGKPAPAKKKKKR